MTDSGSDQHGSAEDGLTEDGLTEHSLDESVADQIEQHQEAVPDAEESAESELPLQVPLEADEADTAEQAREVSTGEDEYR